MGLSTSERSAFIALMPHLAVEDEDELVLTFVRDNWRACLSEVAANPGFDQVRAGLIRALRPLRSDDDVHEALDAAGEVIADFPEQIRNADATLLLSRHPAWVGLSALELAAGDPSVARDPVGWAITLASQGFASLAGKGATGRGEVLWALAEQADEVGWTDRSRQLLELAERSDFADPEHAVRVKLLLGLRLLEDGEPGAEDLLEDVARSPIADARTATHARGLLAEARHRRGDFAGARYWLQEARDQVDPDDEPSLMHRLDAGLAALEDA